MSAPQVRFHDALSLFSAPEALTLEPMHAPAAVPRHSLVFARTPASSGAAAHPNNNTTIRIDSPPAPTLAQEQRETVYGIIGVIVLNAGYHLILITNRSRVARVFNNDIYQLTGHKIVPVARNSAVSLSPSQIADDIQYMSMLESLLSSAFWYFSYNGDITKNVQRLATEDADARSFRDTGRLRSWEKADDRFFWNKSLHQPLIDLAMSHPDLDISPFILPIICGFVSFKELSYNNKKVSLGLISRRSKYRAGTRYNRRGIDEEGNVANNVETEQILSVQLDGALKVASYVQTRGSIPLYWSQLINVKYQPKMVVEDGSISFPPYKKHFLSQITLYGPQIAVNLINKKGYEGRLCETWANLNTQLNDPNVRYIHFDFHHECKGNRWDRLSKLIGDIEGDLITQGYSSINATSAAKTGAMELYATRLQTSVVRTNCMDCLDRTNVVQSVLAHRVLPLQLQEFCGGVGVLDTEFEVAFKNLWADHADAISLVYSGTGALKTDFTRTGKRTIGGILADGANSAMRYVKNNFFDGQRQDSFDLFLGNYKVNPLASSPFDGTQRPLRFFLLPSGLILGLVMLLATLLMFHYSSSYYVIALAFWSILVVVSFRGILHYGTDFVDRPRLVKWNQLVPESDHFNEKPVQIFAEDLKNK
ncbi:hypothetical protein HDU82_000003 [Entophlyctis luteolus]|nr:hypothetical protein HDU82_000003 [Entophlyctis luteolus]